MKVTEKTGEVIAINNVTDDDDLIIINQSGITLRLPLQSIRVMGRNTQGVKLIDLTKRGDSIASVCKVTSDPEDGEVEVAEEAGEAVGAEASDDAPAVSETEDDNNTTE